MKPIESIDWKWMKRNLHESGFEKLVERLNEVIERINALKSFADPKNESVTKQVHEKNNEDERE